MRKNVKLFFILLFVIVIFSGCVNSQSQVKSTTTNPPISPVVTTTPKTVATADQVSDFEWIWSRDGWGDWQHTASWSGSTSGPNSEYGPVIVNDHGEHGANINLNGGSTEASISQTFTDPTGIGWNTLEFTGLLTATDVPNGRWITIDVNDQQIYKGTAAQNPPGNGAKFTITRSFPQSSSIKVKISNGQSPAWRPLFAMHFYSVKLTRPATSQSVQPIRTSAPSMPTPGQFPNTATNENKEVTIYSVKKTSTYNWVGYTQYIHTERAKPGKIFIIIDAEVKNLGSNSIYVGPGDFSFSDSEGNRYDFEPYIGDDGFEILKELFGNQKERGRIVFEVPTNANGLTLYYDYGNLLPWGVKYATWGVN